MIVPPVVDIELPGRYYKSIPFLWCPGCHSSSLMGMFTKKVLSPRTFSLIKENISKSKDHPLRQCPFCSVALKTMSYRSEDKTVKFEVCPKCFFLFLDKDEQEAFKFQTEEKEQEKLIEFHKIEDGLAMRSLGNWIFNIPDVKSRYQAIEDFPYTTVLVFVVCMLIYFVKGLNELAIFDPRDFNIIQFFTHHLAHWDKGHLAANMGSFLVFSGILEIYIGHKRIAVLFAEIASFSSLIFYCFGPNTPVAGLSGIIFGLMGALFRLMPDGQLSYYKTVPVLMMILKFNVSFYVFFGLYFLLDLFNYFKYGHSTGIGYFAHIVGFVVGYFLADGIPSKLKGKKKNKSPSKK